MSEQGKNIAFHVLKYLAPCGSKGGRYIYVNHWRNELIDYIAEKLEIDITDDLRLIVEAELKSAWQNILLSYSCRESP